MSLFSNNKFSYEKEYDKAKQVQRKTGVFNFESPISKYNDNIIPFNSFTNPDSKITYNTDLIENKNYNADTLEENHMLDQAYSLQEEITIADMMEILKEVKTKWNSRKIKGFLISKNKITLLAYHLLFQINTIIFQKKLSNDKHKFSFFIINKLFPLETKNKRSFKFAIKINRPGKIYSFNIETEIKMSNINNANYEELKLTGINSDYEFDNYKKDKLEQNMGGPTVDKLRKFVDYDKEFALLNKKINLNYDLFSKDPTYHLQYSENVMLYPESDCFILDKDNAIKELDIQNPVKCRSYWKEYGFNGVWDSKCKKNEDCPYYNSTTGKGGCDDKSGVCSFPVGAVRIGYTKELKEGSKAKCADCPIADPYCCYNDKNPKYKFID